MLKKILKFLLLAAIFTPLIKFSNTVFPYVFAKAIFFQIIISVAAVLYVFLLIKGEIGWPRRSRLLWAILIFLLAITIASLLGVDFAHSFFDVQERMTGIFNLLHYVAFWLMLVSVFKTPEEGRQLALVAWTAGMLLMLSGYIQLVDPGFWGYEALSRIAGLLNNPIFYAMAMVFLVFLSLFLATNATNKKQKIIFFLSSLAAFYAIFLSQTRGSVIGAVAGLLLFGLVEVLMMKDKNKKMIIFAAFVLFCAIIFGLWLKRDTVAVKKLPISYYLDISPFVGTGATRLIAWKAAYSGFLEHPIFGWGLNNFNIIFNKFYAPEILRYTAYETWFDRTHNVTLEFLSTTGIVGLAGYLSIFATVFWLLFKKLRATGEDSRPLLFLGAALTAYFIQNQFALDQPTSLLSFFLFLALISIYGESPDKLVVIKKHQAVIPWIALAVVIFSIYRFNVIPLYAGYLDVVGVATVSRDYGFSKTQFKKAFELSHPYRFDTVIEFAQTVIQASVAREITGEVLASDFSYAEREMKKLLAKRPEQTYYWYLLGRFYSEWSRHDAKYISLAEEAFRAASALSPFRQQIFFGLGQLYLYSKQYEKAEENFRQMMNLEPRVGESHWYLGLALHQLGRNQETLAELEQAYEFGYVPKTADELGFYVNFFENLKRYEDIALIYERYIGERDPGNGELVAKEAAAWLAAGDLVRAREALNAAIKYDSSLQAEATVFLKMIEEAEHKLKIKN